MKSSKFRFLRLVALVIVMAQLLSLSTVVAFASSNDETIQPTETILPEESTFIDNSSSTKNFGVELERELKPVISSDKVTASEQILLEFDTTDVVDHYYVASGVTVTENMNNSMQFELIAVDEFGSIDVYADYGNGKLKKSSIYTYKQGDIVYVSDVSKDQAWYNCMKEQYDSGLLTIEEWEEAYSALSRTFIERDEVERDSSLTPMLTTNSNVSLMAAASTTTTVTGRLRWEIEKDGTKLPLKVTKVELRDKRAVGSRSIATGYTDTNGYFTFTFDNTDDWYNFEDGGLDVFIRWYIESETFKVAQDWAVTSYYFDTDVVENVSTGSTTEFYYYVKYDDTINSSKATYVQQGMVVGQRFAKAMGLSTENFIHVVYPSGIFFDDSSAFCWGNVAENCFSVIGKDNFDDIDTLIHEYGHFVECSMGNYGSKLLDIITGDPTHFVYTDHFNDKENKMFAMNLMWSEAWATAFSQIAQEYYESEYSSLPNFGDVKDGSTSYESYSPSNQSCEAQENAVIAVLWDLFDEGENETFDKVKLGYQTWWNYTTRPGTCTLTDFVNVIETYYPSYRGDIGAIMAMYQISPGNLTITNKSSVSTSTPPTLSWTVNGSTYNPNNRFQVVFYDTSGNYIYSSPAITSTQAYNTPYTYPVSQSVWNQVLKNYGGTVTLNIAVRGYHTEDPISGPYSSQYAPITLTVNTNLNISASNRYTEKIINLQPSQYIEYDITFGNSGTKLIQTFGTKDAMIYLYDANGVLLDSDDDSGYNLNALLAYNVTQGVKYTVRVKFYNSNQSGEVKLAIMSTSAYSTYENIFVGPNNWSSHSGTLSPYNVALLRYNTTTAKTVTFTTEATFDTYLYIIDPRSTAPISSSTSQPSTYNDDGAGNLQAKITKTIDANVPYLIIVSAYNPSSQSGEYQINFN